MTRLTAVLCVVFIAFTSTVLSAQTAATASVSTQALIYLRPGMDVPLRVAAAGTILKVLREEGEWVEVEFNDPQYGRRVGWVQGQLIRISRPELQPMDLSVGPKPAPVTSRARDVEPPAAVSPHVTAEPARTRARGWIDVNFGFAVANEDAITAETVQSDGAGELETYRVDYRFPTGAAFDFGGGVMVTPVIGFGIQFTGTAHEDEADLFVRIPHPRFFNEHATDTSTTDDKLMRVEGGVNLSVVAAPINQERVLVRVYGGPTWFRLQADAVSDIRYYQEFGLFNTFNSVEIHEYDTEEVEETGWGFHVGGDVAYYFNRRIGIGGFGRFTRGTITLRPEDFLVSENFDITAGGFQAGGGLRIRF